MDYFPNLPAEHFARPAAWAERMEHAGWHGPCASDHILLGTNRYPHVFVTAAALATATHRIKIMTSFANKLFRSPVAPESLSLLGFDRRQLREPVPRSQDLLDEALLADN